MKRQRREQQVLSQHPGTSARALPRLRCGLWILLVSILFAALVRIAPAAACGQLRAADFIAFMLLLPYATAAYGFAGLSYWRTPIGCRWVSASLGLLFSLGALPILLGLLSGGLNSARPRIIIGLIGSALAAGAVVSAVLTSARRWQIETPTGTIRQRRLRILKYSITTGVATVTADVLFMQFLSAGQSPLPIQLGAGLLLVPPVAGGIYIVATVCAPIRPNRLS